jgi:hypothetical protein
MTDAAVAHEARLWVRRRAVRRLQGQGVGRQDGIAGFDQYTELKSVADPASK